MTFSLFKRVKELKGPKIETHDFTCELKLSLVRLKLSLQLKYKTCYKTAFAVVSDVLDSLFFCFTNLLIKL